MIYLILSSTISNQNLMKQRLAQQLTQTLNRCDFIQILYSIFRRQLGIIIIFFFSLQALDLPLGNLSPYAEFMIIY